MTHKVHPYAHRLGKNKTWRSKWITPNLYEYKLFLKTDFFIRDFLEKELRSFYVSDIKFERNSNKKYLINVYTSRPGMIIGRSGDGVEKITKKIKKVLRRNDLDIPSELKLIINDVHSPDSDAGIVISQVIEGLEKRMSFNRVVKRIAEKVIATRGVKGVKIAVSGRLDGSDMARRVYIRKGQIPLTTFRADIDYRDGRANLSYGVLGVKVWIYKGEVFADEKK